MKTIQKILPVFLLFLSYFGTLNAQMSDGRTRFGIKAGVNGSSLYDDAKATDKNTRTGITAGVFVQMPLGKGRFSLRPELLFVTKGGAYEYLNGNRLDYKINYVELPLLLEYHLFGFLNLHAGAYAAMVASADGTVSGTVSTLNRANFEQFDYGWQAGTGLDLGSLGVHFRISRALKNVSTQTVSALLGDVKNAAWSLALSYGF